MRLVRLSRLFKTIVLSASACSPTPEMPDGGMDATMDAAEAAADSSPFGDSALVDSYVVWCDAGPPEFLTIVPTTCNDMLYVPCGLPPDDYIRDAGLAPNQINRCDQVCKGWQAASCEVMTYGTVETLLAFVDGGDAAAIGDAQDLDAIPPLDSPLYVSCDCTSGGRRPVGLRRARLARASPLGMYFGKMAHLEAASVPAFERMRSELRALGAPRRLLARVERAVRDEKRHARAMGTLARLYGGAPPAVRMARFRPRSALAMARENMIEGCVRETYGALLATWQAQHAQDARIKAAMSRIAADETRHAELSWDVARFLGRKLDASKRGRLERTRRRAIERLYADASRDPHAEIVSHVGMPRASVARSLLDALRASVWLTSFA